jgi:hypothetical protein
MTGAIILIVAEGATQLGDQFLADELVRLVDLAFDQGAVGRAVGQCVGERLLVGADLLALLVAEEIEELDRFEVRRLGGMDEFLDARLRQGRGRRTGGNAVTG